MKIPTFLLCLISPALLLGLQPPSRIQGNIESRQTFTLAGNTRPALANAQDQGRANPALQLPHITLHLAMTASQNAALQQLLTDQQTRGNSRYHQWLTPEQYGEQFGVSAADLQKITDWLQGLGFSNVEIARSRNAVSFSGTAGQAESAFQTSIHRYLMNGQSHFANASDPILPKALQGMVEGIRGLHDFHPKPLGIRRAATQPHFTSSISGNHFLIPDDFATIYDVKPLYATGIDGTGQTIAIPGQSDIALSDIEAFRSAAGLPPNDPQVILTGTDPGTSSSDESESDLDIEWAGGVAKNATIIFVNSTDVFTSVTYAVQNNVAPVLSITYGNCEADMGTTEINSLTTLFEQANSQGMTVLAASGDNGAADCDNSNAKIASHGLAVDVPASIPYVTALGGTEFNEGSGTYWSAANNADSGSALSYIPEMAWNDTAANGSLAASGGGKSTYFTKPTWQTGTGVPYDGARDVPDLAFAGSPDHDGYIICSAGSCVNGFREANQDLNVFGGTSAATPSFAAIVALLNQQTGDRQGNINPTLYALASVSANAFHDITQGNNIVPCRQGSPDCPTGGEIGYSTGVGYDQVTGWGSVDAQNLVSQWTSYTPSPVTEMPGGAQQLSVGSDGTVFGISTNGDVYSYSALTQAWTSDLLVLSQISVGGSGAAWGLDASGQVYSFNAASQTWQLVPGNLSQIAVGSDGSAWGVNSIGSIYTFNSQTASFTQILGTLSQIAVGFDGAVWGLNPSGQIYRFNPGSRAFDYVPGTLAQISVGADGDVWGINPSGSIYHFDRLTQGWDQTAGTLKMVSVGSGANVWGLNPESDVFTFNLANDTWTEVQGVLRSLSASANGSVWGIDYSNQSYELFQPTQASQAWHGVSGTLTQVAVSSDGNVWGINASQQIYTFNPLTQSWTNIPGQLSQIAVAANGAVWGLNASNEVFQFDPSTQQFIYVSGSLSQIAVADTGDVWGINAADQIYRFNSSNQTFSPIAGSLAQIAVGVDGDAWGIDSRSSVYHFNTQTQAWNPVGFALSQIAVGSSANVWGLDTNGFIYRFNPQTLTWNVVPGNLAHIAVAFDGAVWGINSGQQVYRFDSQTQTWNNIPGALARIAIGSDAVVWGINTAGQIYYFR